MDSNWAGEHLQVIRTLMERSALYRRALAPIMIYNGVLGLLGTAAGWGLGIASPRAFIPFWAGVSALALVGSFLLVRRQALKEAEPFWSPPTRRVSQAMVPALVAGGIIGAVVFVQTQPGATSMPIDEPRALVWLAAGWVILYGCGFHAAGFFMPRGMRLFGWSFILGGCALVAAGLPGAARSSACAHGLMGVFFGGLHVAYGIYLYFTEQRGKEL